MPTSPAFAYLESIFPGMALLPVLEAGQCLSYAPQTIKNKVHNGTFPVKTILVGGKRVVKKTDLAYYIDGLGQDRPRRGRRTKAELLGGSVGQ
ncbi:hypothetical protein [Cupriavidus metallidurans]|uniref:DNA-binding protein n=1 Tax=Cupriavidus metallidurans (strain ATCC 43123 / DSM 2839 / NBRC 102507 / CH34) TaxID=266264 RepID=Q1LJH9_CUPMC|nr:hypothetical protein [Cupriavidus metallidurans]ABF09697.1 conserved hypothetical protein [Cupriavidus metallidurans CH34]QGS29464.1 hypothetical protein FOB83_11505 [Cupriavidus metallidurans]